MIFRTLAHNSKDLTKDKDQYNQWRTLIERYRTETIDNYQSLQLELDNSKLAGGDDPALFVELFYNLISKYERMTETTFGENSKSVVLCLRLPRSWDLLAQSWNGHK